MSEHNKHHHRKSKAGKQGPGMNGKGGSATPGSATPAAAASAKDSQGAGDSIEPSTGLKEDDTSLHFGDATLQSAEEHNTDKNKEITGTDKTTANS